ncbi:MAG TPA: ABC transporter permease, partial [Acidobacteriota bacterium]|nr:ABC transporter permease [Acidobacteriota bacterium]
IDLGVVQAESTRTREVLRQLQEVKTLRVQTGFKEAELKALEKGERTLVVEVAPSGAEVTAYLNEARPQEAQLGALLVQEALDQMALKKSGTGRLILKQTTVKSRKLTYMDFLVPGILAMSIMQMGIFSVAFVFVDLKKRGILRRLRVTPMNPNDFIIAQVFTRLIVLMMQIVVMVAVGIVFFKLNFIGSLWQMFVFGILGAVVFLGMGFALAGLSRSEDQVAPLANVVTMPQMLLSGIFFSRANLPGFAHVLTQFFPLTFLADGMRSLAIDGSTLSQIWPDISGLLVWSLLTTVVAVKLFRWE